MQARRGELMDVLEGEALVAVDSVGMLGVVSWCVGPASTAEIRALAVARRARRRGVGSRLLKEAHARLRERGIRSVWLITTNDNAGAIALYRGAGYRLKARHTGAVDELRRTIKPSIAEIGAGGVPITDELEFELGFAAGDPPG